MKPLPINAVTVVTTISPVDIVTIIPNKKEKSLFQPVTTTVFPSDKLPASLSSISVPQKQTPVETDNTIPRIDIVGPEFR